jgi:hypothetical protein
MDQVSVKYTNIFNCKTLQNLPEFVFLVWKQTIWQPCLCVACHATLRDMILPIVECKYPLSSKKVLVVCL